nr:immunoglobulin light chain junction region [Macaca mulatta]
DYYCHVWDMNSHHLLF